MENKSHVFWTRVFTIVLVLGTPLVVFFFNVDRTVRVPYDLIARTNVTGLFTDAAVRYRGLGVGKVESIKFDKSHPWQIRIRILVDQNVPMTHSTYATLGFQGVTGIAFVQLDDPARIRPRLHCRRSMLPQCRCARGLFEQLQERDDVILKRFERLSDDADKVPLRRRAQSVDGHDQKPEGRGGQHRDARESGFAPDVAVAADAQADQHDARFDQSARAEPESPGRPVSDPNLNKAGRRPRTRARRSRT